MNNVVFPFKSTKLLRAHLLKSVPCLVGEPRGRSVVRCPLVGSHVRPRLPSPRRVLGPQRDKQQRPSACRPTSHTAPFCCRLPTRGLASSPSCLTPSAWHFSVPEGLVSFQTQGVCAALLCQNRGYNSTFLMLTPGGTQIEASRVGARVWWPSGLHARMVHGLTVSRALSRGRPSPEELGLLAGGCIRSSRTPPEVCPARPTHVLFSPVTWPLTEVACAVSSRERRAVSLHL